MGPDDAIFPLPLIPPPASTYDPPACAMEMYLDIPAFKRRLGDWEHHYESVRTNGNHQLSFGTLSAAAMHRARAGYYGLS
ncbi:hypothetical protein [Arthrobacter alpinus]|uniref:hypothetical protein n=1 Tax=Arthrobacter alpinus TaxID=656366 RepID=UPI0021BD5EC3|nr:hypothetical protein [Arthrobacter alpinus]